jgi:polyhydroxybutyrate depolymerase
LTQSIPANQCNADGDREPRQETIQVDGFYRSYWLVPPQEIDTRERSPLVLIFHGSGGTGQAMYQDGKEIIANVPANALLAFPDGRLQDWHYGQVGWDVRRPDALDLAFVSSLVNELRTRHCIDDDRIYAIGFSWGSWMASAIGCVFGAEVAGISIVSGGPPMFELGECKGQGVAAFIVHGRADPVEPFVYGEKARDAWQQLNGCEAQESVLDNHKCIDFENCRSGKQVRWCPHDGGHSAPARTWSDMWQFFDTQT